MWDVRLQHALREAGERASHGRMSPALCEDDLDSDCEARPYFVVRQLLMSLGAAAMW
jgi:hypothetical protein